MNKEIEELIKKLSEALERVRELSEELSIGLDKQNRWEEVKEHKRLIVNDIELPNAKTTNN